LYQNRAVAIVVVRRCGGVTELVLVGVLQVGRQRLLALVELERSKGSTNVLSETIKKIIKI
jgi:hypothetical protein